eukprot:3359700-Pyramimonas_sp.AAC.1
MSLRRRPKGHARPARWPGFICGRRTHLPQPLPHDRNAPEPSREWFRQPRVLPHQGYAVAPRSRASPSR